MLGEGDRGCAYRGEGTLVSSSGFRWRIKTVPMGSHRAEQGRGCLGGLCQGWVTPVRGRGESD